MKFTAALSQRLRDPEAEAVRANIDQRIGELQGLPIAGAVIFRDVVLGDTQAAFIRHGLGRRVSCFPSIIRGAATAGLIEDFGGVDPAGNPNDVTKSACLRARGWGATITVDFLLVPR